MSNWIAIVVNDLNNAKAAALITAADSQSLAAGQPARSTTTIADVTAEIRRKVGKLNQLDQDTTKIPFGLKNLALDIIICRLKVALEQELSEDERNALKRRYQELDDIRDGKEMVDPPDNPIAANEEQALPSPSFGCRPRLRRFNEEG